MRIGDRSSVVRNETSENCRDGAPDDGTHLLHTMRKAKLPNARFGFIVDGEVAAQLHTAVTGATIEESLAGKYPSAWARWL